MLLDNYTKFLDRIFTKLSDLEIDISQYVMDHIGYQCSSDSDYDKQKSSFSEIGDLLDENIVGGRRVGLFKLNQPLQYKHYQIDALELIAPKEGQVCASGLEHVEFVISEPFDTFMARYPAIKWDTNAVNQPVFPMVKLPLDTDIQVKFHYEHIFDIVARKNPPV
jgi:predicted metalloenzyme YecM